MREGNWEKSETEYLPLMNLATGGLNEINPRSMESPRVNSPTQEQMGPCGPRGPAALPSQGQGSELGTLEVHFLAGAPGQKARQSPGLCILSLLAKASN